MAKKTLKAKEPVRIREKVISNGNKSLYLDIYRNGKRSYEFLKLYLVPIKSVQDKMANQQTMIQANAIKAQRILELTNEEAGIMTKNKSNLTLISWLEIIKKDFQSKGGQSQASNTSSVIRLLKDFDDKILLSDVDRDFCVKFTSYLRTECKTKRGTPLSQTTAKNYWMAISYAMNEAVRRNMIVKNPFFSIPKNERIKSVESQRVYLTIEEQKKLVETKCKYDSVKNAFMFSCTTGLRISDVRKLKWKDIEPINKTDFRLSILQKKTKTAVYMTIDKTQTRYLPQRGDSEDLVFTLPSKMTVIRSLSKWVEDAGIDKHVTFHISRHSFATTMLTVGGELYTISKLMGHRDVKTTQIYAKIIDKKKDETMKLLDGIYD